MEDYLHVSGLITERGWRVLSKLGIWSLDSCSTYPVHAQGICHIAQKNRLNQDLILYDKVFHFHFIMIIRNLVNRFHTVDKYIFSLCTK